MNCKILHFGAGNIGKGLISEILFNNEIPINLIDINEATLQKINNNGFTIKYLNSHKEIKLKPKKTWCLKRNDELIIKNLINTDYVTTSMGANNLHSIQKIIAEAVKKRTIKSPLILICFENYYEASQYLYELIKSNLSQTDYEKIGFINVVVDRIVPKQISDNFVLVDDSYQIYFEKNQYHFPFKCTNFIKAVDDYRKYYYQKLFAVNGLHLALAFVSKSLGFKYVNELNETNWKQENLKKILEEFAVSVSNILKLNYDSTMDYLNQNSQRFLNPNLHDENERVLRNLKLKLEPNERIFRLVDYFNSKKEKNLITNLYQKMKASVNE